MWKTLPSESKKYWKKQSCKNIKGQKSKPEIRCKKSIFEDPNEKNLFGFLKKRIVP